MRQSVMADFRSFPGCIGVRAAVFWLVLCAPVVGDEPATELSSSQPASFPTNDEPTAPPSPLPAALPADEAPAPPRAPIKKTPIPQGDAYRFDAEYQKLLRYDFLPYWLSREKRMRLENGEDLEPAIQVRDRALVLAGKGFRNPGAAVDPRPYWKVNPYFHVKEDTPPAPLPPRPDSLDPGLEEVVRQRPLVFHSQISGFYDVPLVLPLLEEAEAPEPPPSPPEVPGTRVLLSSGSKTLLRLEPSGEHWDLLRDPFLLQKEDPLGRVEADR